MFLLIAHKVGKSIPSDRRGSFACWTIGTEQLGASFPYSQTGGRHGVREESKYADEWDGPWGIGSALQPDGLNGRQTSGRSPSAIRTSSHVMAQGFRKIPVLEGFDHTLGFLREGYEFISRRCDQTGTDFFRARLMLRPVICARGSAAAEMFYDNERFTRRGAMPPTALRLLQDKGSVQLLDGVAHRCRKELFVDLLMHESAETEFLDLFRIEWLHMLSGWLQQPSIVLFDQVNLVLTRAISRWMGVPLADKSSMELAHELSSMIENAGRIGPSVFFALARRRKSERFVVKLIQKVRGDAGSGTSGSPLERIARFRSSDGERLSAEAAAVEAINILRPTVAIGRYIMFAAMALKDNPQWRIVLRGAEDALYERFAEEVRRLYPFFPVIGGIARAPFEWEGYRFRESEWILLDLYGTNHDPRLFPDPHAFDPERNLSWRNQGYDFVPQGAGRTPNNHRCPGEQFTVATIREATRLLVEEMEYEVPEQDFSMPLSRMPARPKSGMIIAKIRRASRQASPNG